MATNENLSLYENNNYTPVALDVGAEINAALAPIFAKYKNVYSIRELAHLAMGEVFDLECNTILEI